MNHNETVIRERLSKLDDLIARIVNSGALSTEQFEDLEAECCAEVDVVKNIQRQEFRQHLEHLADQFRKLVEQKPAR